MDRLSSMRRRLSYSNVVATLALFLALGGGAAIAAGTITDADIAPNAVGGSELKKDAARGKHVKEDSLGPVPTAGKANNLLWAVVQDPTGPANANVVRAGQTNTGVIEAGNVVEVELSRDIVNCVWIATRGSIGAGNEPAGFVQVSLGSTPTRVQVRTRNTAGEVIEGDFHIVVVC